VKQRCCACGDVREGMPVRGSARCQECAVARSKNTSVLCVEVRSGNCATSRRQALATAPLATLNALRVQTTHHSGRLLWASGNAHRH
jgi:hypothetical protein